MENFNTRKSVWMARGVWIAPVAALVLWAGCSDSGNPTDPGNGNGGPKTVTINVADFSFSPSNAQIMEGDTVRWVWQSGSHTTTSGTGAADPNAGDLWNQPMNAQNTSFTRVFDAEGSFPYFCAPHEPNMRANIQVSAR